MSSKSKKTGTSCKRKLNMGNAGDKPSVPAKRKVISTAVEITSQYGSKPRSSKVNKPVVGNKKGNKPQDSVAKAKGSKGTGKGIDPESTIQAKMTSMSTRSRPAHDPNAPIAVEENPAYKVGKNANTN